VPRCRPGLQVRSYVYQRLKLNDLIKEAQSCFSEIESVLGTRDTCPARQETAEGDSGNHLFTHQDEPVSCGLSDYVVDTSIWILVTFRGRSKTRNLCPRRVGVRMSKRTGSNPSLFTDMQHDICTDRGCFEKKMQAHIQKRFDSHPGCSRFRNTRPTIRRIRRCRPTQRAEESGAKGQVRSAEGASWSTKRQGRPRSFAQ